MSINPEEPAVANILHILPSAAQRGADVQFAADAYTYLYARRFGLLTLPEYIMGSEKVAIRDRAFANLRDNGVTVGILNQPDAAITPLHHGRSHIKAFAINDEIRIGGPNFHDINRLDIVAGLHDSASADVIHSFIGKCIEYGRVDNVLSGQDATEQLYNEVDLVVDAGKPGRSAILERVLAMIGNSDGTLTYASQYYPTGKTLRALIAAHGEGADVQILYNHPSKHDGFNSYHHALLRHQQRTSAAPQSFFAYQIPTHLPKSHMTAIATETEAVVTGHNFIRAGVQAGTAELALFGRTPHFANSVRNVIRAALLR